MITLSHRDVVVVCWSILLSRKSQRMYGIILKHAMRNKNDTHLSEFFHEKPKLLIDFLFLSYLRNCKSNRLHSSSHVAGQLSVTPHPALVVSSCK